MSRSRTQWICGGIAAFLAVAASADAPMYKSNNRFYENSVYGESCTDLEFGYRCRAINVWENYDVKGTFENTQATFHAWMYEQDPGDGSYEEGWRDLTCLVGEKTISAHPNRVTIDVTLDTEAPECYQSGTLHTWDPVNGDQWFPFAFSPGIRVFEGEWMDPFSHGSSMWNSKDEYYDGWSGMTSKGVHLCRSAWGDMMTRGWFSTTSPTGRTAVYEFSGPDGATWSFFNVFSCNANQIQK
jgi:hypothetical protein